MTNAPYDEVAGYYDEFVQTSGIFGTILPALEGLLPNLVGQHICDIACGQGWLSRLLARRGGQVVGVDISENLLHIARRYEAEEPLGITYLQEDAQALAGLPDSSFDGATCNMALMDIPDLPAALHSARRVLKTCAWFVFSITHPCWEAPHAVWSENPDGKPIRITHRYLAEGFWRSGNVEGLRYRVGAHHRTIGTYLNALADAGFAVQRVLEPPASGKRLEEVPGNAEMPSIMLLRVLAV